MRAFSASTKLLPIGRAVASRKGMKSINGYSGLRRSSTADAFSGHGMDTSVSPVKRPKWVILSLSSQLVLCHMCSGELAAHMPLASQHYLCGPSLGIAMLREQSHVNLHRMCLKERNLLLKASLRNSISISYLHVELWMSRSAPLLANIT